MNLIKSRWARRAGVLPALGLAAALYGPACSPARTTGPVANGDEDGAESAYDSGVVPTGATRDDAGGLDASRAKRDASADAGTQDAVSAGDARDRDAGRAPPDASEGSDARVDSGVSSAVSASAGCGKSNRPNGGRIAAPAHNYIFPEAYDGAEPFPMLIGFHAANNPIEQIENLTRGSDFERSFVRALPKSKGSAWDYGADISNVRAMYDDLMANHCVDRNRVFATGHSSGAQLIVQILTPAHKTDADYMNFRAVAPVAASRYGGVSRAIPVMYIQGAHDNVRNSDGSDVVMEFRTANSCQATSLPYERVMSCTSGGKSVKDGCVQYGGCSAPTVWCRHDDPQYSNTNHGWPCFATKAMFDFFTTLP